MASGYRPIRELIQNGHEHILFLHDLWSDPSNRINAGELTIDNQRHLAVASPEDVVIIERKDNDYISWLNHVGLGPSDGNIIELGSSETWQNPVARLVQNSDELSLVARVTRGKDFVLSPFYATQYEEVIAETLGIPMYERPSKTALLTDKLFFKRLCESINVGVVKYQPFFAYKINPESHRRRLEDMIKQMASETGKVIIRSSYGALDTNNYIVNCSNKDEEIIRKVIMAAMFGRTFLVEPLEERLSSPALIYFITKDGNLHYIGDSEQQLSPKLEYSGAKTPMRLRKFTPESLAAVGNRIAERIKSIGYTGTFNIDFIESSHGIYPVECNARFCSSLYTIMINEIMKKRHGGYEPSLTFSLTGLTDIHNFRQLQQRIGGMLYDGTSIDSRVIPINVGHLRNGRVVVVFTAKSEADLIECYNTFVSYVRK